MSLPFLSVAVVLPLLLNAQEEKLHGTSGGDALKTSDFEVPFLARGQPDDDLMAPGARAAKEVSVTRVKNVSDLRKALGGKCRIKTGLIHSDPVGTNMDITMIGHSKPLFLGRSTVP